MGGNTLESMQQWHPSNLTVGATISPKDIKRTGDLCCGLYCIFCFENLYVNLYLLVDAAILIIAM